MTMLSFRVDNEAALDLEHWSRALGVDRSELLRDALHRHLTALSSEHDVAAWEATPMSDAEFTVSAIADWGPAEDWSDWSDATG